MAEQTLEQNRIAKLIAYKAQRKLANISLLDQQQLCENLFTTYGTHVLSVTEIFNMEKYELKIFQSICKFCSNFGDEDILIKLNVVIGKQDLNGKKITDEEVRKLRNQWEEAERKLTDVDFTRKEKRLQIYGYVSKHCITDAIYIVNFLLPYNLTIIDTQISTHDYLWKMLNTWDDKTPSKKRIWTTLRNILLFFKHENAVKDIENKFG